MSMDSLVPSVLVLVTVLIWPWPVSASGAAVGVVLRARDEGQGTPAPLLGRTRLVTLLGSRRRPDCVPTGFLDALAAALRSGLTARDALRVAAADPGMQSCMDAHAQWLDAVREASATGSPVGPVWQQMAARRGDPDLAALGRAWHLSERLGAPLADAVSGAADVARSRAAREAAIRSATAGAGVTSTLLSVLPLGGVVLAAGVGISPLDVYGTPVALASVGLGGILLGLGRWWVRRLTRAVYAAG